MREEIVLAISFFVKNSIKNAKKYFMENPAIMEEVDAKVRAFYMPDEEQNEDEITAPVKE